MVMTFCAEFGVILAGGQGSRMGYKDKCLLTVGGTPIIERVIANARPQVNELLLSINRNADKYAYLKLQSFPDYTDEVSGPLLGIVSAMRFIHKRQIINACAANQLLACFAADVPHFPPDLICRLRASMQAENTDLALASFKGELQPLFSLWKLSLLPALEEAIIKGNYGPKMVLSNLKFNVVDFDTDSEANAQTDERLFFNINNEDDYKTAQKLFKES